MGWDFRLNTKEKTSWAETFVIFCFLTMGSMWAAASWSCRHDEPQTTNPNKPCLSELLLVRYLVMTIRNWTNAVFSLLSCSFGAEDVINKTHECLFSVPPSNNCLFWHTGLYLRILISDSFTSSPFCLFMLTRRYERMKLLPLVG